MAKTFAGGTQVSSGYYIDARSFEFANIAKDGIAYVGLEFGCEWDSEHGMGVMLHRDRILELSQADSSFNGHLARKDGGEYLRRGKR